MMLCYSKTRKIKNFLDPPSKKRLKNTNDRDMSTRTSGCLYMYQECVTWIFTRSGLNRLSDLDYKVIPSLENTQSYNARATHFKTNDDQL